MRVAWLNGFVSRANGGVFEAARRLAQEIYRPESVEVKVIGLKDKYSLEDASMWAPMSPEVFAPALSNPYGYSGGYGRALAAFKPDVSHVHGLWLYPTLAARKWSAKGGAPYLITIHGMMEPWAMANSKWKKVAISTLFEKENLRRAACLHALTQREVEIIREHGLTNPICMLPNGIDLPNKTKRFSPWGALGIEGNVLLYLGRIHPKKGLGNLLEAWARCAHVDSTGVTWNLVIAGWDQDGHEAELQMEASSLGIADSVFFIGPQFGEAKLAAYAAASAFVLPSLSEGLPMVVLEAWAHNLPVLLTPACNVPEGCHASIVVDPEIESIKTGLEKLMKMSPAERAEMGAAGYQLVSNSFSWKRIAAEMLKVYRWLLDGSDKPDCVSLG
jgi:glycosyltransferase involved in cell wall biosynthesis